MTYATELAARIPGASMSPVRRIVLPIGRRRVFVEPGLTAPVRGQLVHSVSQDFVHRRSDVVTVHDFLPDRFPELSPKPHDAAAWRKMVRRALRTPIIITDTQYVADQLTAEHGVRSDRIHPVHLGVSEEFRPDLASWEARKKLSGDQVNLLIVANMSPHKRVDLLLKSVALLDERYHVLHIGRPWGTGAWDQLLRQEAGKLGPRYRNQAMVPRDQLLRELRTADALLHPNLDCGFGLPLLEAAASGCPVVSTDIPPYREVAGDFAEFFPAGDVQAGARAIERATRGQSLVRRLELSQQVKSRFDWSRTAEETVQVYAESVQST